MNSVSYEAMAAKCWESFTDDERALVSLGMFPHHKMPKSLGKEGLRLLVVEIFKLQEKK